MINRITSRDNKLLKTARSLHKKKGREQTGLYFAEGVRLVSEALLFIKDKIEFILLSESYFAKNSEIADDTEVYVIPDKLFDDICETQTPQGIAAVIHMENMEKLNFSDTEYLLILDGVSEPGNMGTIIRTAEAAGIDAVILMDGCADIYNSKVVRSAMGSLFRMKFLKGDLDIISNLKQDGFFIVATALENSEPIERVELQKKRAIVIGNEARGVSRDMLHIADRTVRIDMQGEVESLNAAVAAGIAMYMLKD